MSNKLKEAILKVVNQSDYNKGKNYWRNYIDYLGYRTLEKEIVFSFRVESERYYMYYDVDIIKDKSGELQATCDCPQYRGYHSCKHIGACLNYYGDQIIDFDLEKMVRKKSLEIIQGFQTNVQKGIVKEEIQLQVVFDFDTASHVKTVFKVGKGKLYMIKNKMGDFLEAYTKKNQVVEFGKGFTYEPNKHYFNKSNQEIIDWIYQYFSEKINPFYANANNLFLEDRKLKSLLNVLQDKDFTCMGYGVFHGIDKANPFEPIITKQDDEYIFDMNLDPKLFHFLTSDYEYVIKGEHCYQVTFQYASLLEKMVNNGLEKLIFSSKDLPTFSKNIIPIVKEEVTVDSNIDDIVIVKKPSCKLYFDIYRNNIVCNLKLQYGEKELDYFDEDASIYRDNEYETEVLNDLFDIGFLIENKKIKMIELEDIGEFFETNLEKIATLYDTYTSEKIKDTKIIKNSGVTSTFSIGSDNIMNFSFDLGAISSSELDSVLDNLRQRKKYYKLKNGNLVNLESDVSLQQLENLVTDLDLSNKDLKNGTGVIPKYRAIYLDSLKHDKYNIIKTDNLFDNFIDNFKNYRDQSVEIKASEKKILRDYQVTGVKWLYNIHKCDFGGILADEMGLGKSIQIIYFFKKLLKEDKDAKFLIVSPTSLVYNWKEEFKKFAPKLKYEILSTGKTKRHELLEETDANIYITSYGLLREDMEIYLSKNFTVCVIDEAQNIKNPQAGITKAVKSIHAKTKIALTGTPIENSVVELWSIFDFVMPGFFSNQKNFQSKYKVKEFDDDTNQLLDRLNKQIEPFILRRKKKDVLKDLPDKIENNVYIDLSTEQKKLYASEVKRVQTEMDNLIQAEGFTKARFMILQLLTKLRQLCIDPRILFTNYKGESTKIENLLKIVQELIENGHKILLFSSFKTAIDLVSNEFDKNNISYYVINGSVPSKKRMELVKNFNEDDTNVFLITLKAGGTGLNLTSADTVIHLDLWWNPQAENQATDRAHRIGQMNTVTVIKLVSRGTIEEKILELQKKKQMLSDKIIEGETRDQNMLGELTEKELRNLLAYEQEENN